MPRFLFEQHGEMGRRIPDLGGYILQGEMFLHVFFHIMNRQFAYILVFLRIIVCGVTVLLYVS